MKRIKYGDIWGKNRDERSLVPFPESFSEKLFIFLVILVVATFPIKEEAIGTILYYYGTSVKAVVTWRGEVSSSRGLPTTYIHASFFANGAKYRCKSVLSDAVPGDTITVKYLKFNPKFNADEETIKSRLIFIRLE